jgi:hypothetical protein
MYVWVSSEVESSYVFVRVKLEYITSLNNACYRKLLINTLVSKYDISTIAGDLCLLIVTNYSKYTPMHTRD